MQQKLEKLKRYNSLVGLLLLAQGLFMWVISAAKNPPFELPITTNYLSAAGNGPRVGDPPTILSTVGHLQVGFLVAGFLILSGFFLIGSAYLWRKKYNADLKKGLNVFRWIEYSITSSLMLIVIAMLCGVFDLGSLILIFSINACMILFGWVMEVHNQTTEKVNWISYIFGCFAGIVPWIVMGLYFYSALSAATSPVPSFVYWIFGTLFVFFNIFAINMILQYKKVGKWKDYLYGERVYITLSLVAKALLAWQVWGGTLR